MSKRGFVAGAVLALALLGVPSTAGAATDTTGPSLRLQPISHLVTPATVVAMSGTPFSQSLYETPAIQKWSASDASGICDYKLYDIRREPHLVYEGLKTSYRFMIGDVDDAFGGYNERIFALRVEDCAGNWSTSSEYLQYPGDRLVQQTVGRNAIVAFDDNGEYVGGGVPHGASYSTGWSRSKCTRFIGGTNRHSATKGDWARFTYTGSVFGWVTETGPARGSAKIYQDGVLTATVSTYAAKNTGAKVMWANWFAKPGKHTIRVVVAGTAGHARVDVDGFLVVP